MMLVGKDFKFLLYFSLDAGIRMHLNWLEGVSHTLHLLVALCKLYRYMLKACINRKLPTLKALVIRMYVCIYTIYLFSLIDTVVSEEGCKSL